MRSMRAGVKKSCRLYSGAECLRLLVSPGPWCTGYKTEGGSVLEGGRRGSGVA